MADMNKAEKLAAARRKLKEFQQKSKDHTTVVAKNSTKTSTSKISTRAERNIYHDQSSVFDSGKRISPSNEIQHESSFPPSSVIQPPILLNGDNNGIKEEIDDITKSTIIEENQSVCSSFGEDISFNFSSNATPEVPTLQTQLSAIKESHLPMSTTFSSTFHSNPNDANDFFDNLPSGIQTSYMTENNMQSLATEDENKINFTVQPHSNIVSPELESHLVPHESTLSVNNVLKIDNSHLTDFVLKSEPRIISSEDYTDQKCDSSASELYTSNVSNIDDNSNMNNQTLGVSLPEEGVKKGSRSSTESLRQLSLQLNGLIDESVDTPAGQDNELERRNQELAASLANEQQKTEQLQLQLKEYQSRVSQLQVDVSQLRAEGEAQLSRELHPVQEQLQLHVQTVGILVGEKTELQASLAKSQQTAKQKAAEVEELQGRLKASRHRVNELEKEQTTVNTVNKQLESSSQEQLKEVEKLRMESNMIKKQLEETEEESSELRRKLNSKSNDVVSLRQEIQEKQSHLDLSQLRVQQLSTSDSPDMDSQLETLHQQKVGLERQVVELQQVVQALGSERDQANQQYQEYLQQYNTQLKNMADKLAVTSSENEQLSNREQSLVRHVSELEKQLQQQHTHKSRDSPTRLKEVERLQELEKQLAVVEQEKTELAEKLDTQLQESSNLKFELDERTKSLDELGTMVETLQGDQPDAARLLAAMESDKVAAAQAVGQNQKLKQQLEELQNGFITLSNTKLELTEQLQHEHHICKEQGERLAQQEGELNDLRNQLEEKEKQVQQLHKSSSELSNQMLQHNQIADRMRHYEAQGQITDLLHQELQQSKDRVQALSLQNNELRTLLAHQATQEPSSVDSTCEDSTEDTSNRKDEMLATLSASVRQLELERDQLLTQLQRSQNTPTQQDDSGPGVNESNISTSDVDSKEHTTMKEAMEKLQQRFTRTMEEIAELSDEKQRLEHLVLQLQGETETIGEYIALYQIQRSILRQRTKEKDEQLAQLSQDREDMRRKLNELNNLIRRLMSEKGSLVQLSHDVEIACERNMKTEESQQSQSEGLLNGDVETVTTASEPNESLLPTAIVEHTTSPVSQVHTADKIMALLTEIGNSSLVEPQNSPSFHPCPWCSGRLITV